MEKEEYSIDEILNEVKKRRQEGMEKTEAEQASEEKSEPEEKIEFHLEIEEPVQKNQELKLAEKSESFPEAFDDEEAAEELTSDDEQADETQPEKEEPLFFSDEEEEEQEEISLEEAVDHFSSNENEIIHTAEKTRRQKKDNPKKAKRKKLLKSIIAVLMVIVLCVGTVSGVYVYKALNKVSDGGAKGDHENEWTGMNELVESFPEIEETEATQLSSLKDMIKTWYMNGQPCKSTHVLNVLLIGQDTRGKEILESGTRADSAIIVSINIDTQRITMTSVLRDAFAYWQSTQGDEETGQFGKINGAMAVDGCDIDTYIGCVESLYKIDIDNYVIVNFNSFKQIVDALGGVTLELTSSEIYEINNNPRRYGDVYIEKTFEGDKGELTLTGEQALAYCRIRYIDSDNARADRQKTCLLEIFNETKNGSKSELLKVIKALVPYVKTGFSPKEIILIARYALSHGWLDYEFKTQNIPYNRIEEPKAGGEYYGAWCWKADYPADAYFLQTQLYGKSSITLAQTRVDILACAEEGYYKDGYGPVWATIYNEHYGETTTYEAPTTEPTDEADNISTSN